MQIQFRDLRAAEGYQALHEHVELPRIVEENLHVESLGPVDSNLTAHLADHVCHVEGHLSAEVVYHCSRCLDPCTSKLETEFDELFTDVPGKAVDDVHLASDGIILLDPYIEEAVNLALDYRPLCSEDCRGLCPECGCNRNERTCTCETRSVDPRFAVLQELLADDDEKRDK
ncbi:MAG: DUF177 domain-containing protein [Alicyclobacillus sp.]|nr:DUF177 domain-containing protein [Alicyclobacillus sp.]